MSVLTESAGASAVKVTAIATGAAMSGMETVRETFGVTGQELLWFVTFAYGVLQLYKALPWATLQTIALYKGIFKHDWREFRAIGRREQKATDEGSIAE